MTRIIAGSAKGRRLKTPPGDHTRPTTDRAREALFSAVESWAGSLQGLRFLDLYAGSGAVGLEAFSRGADAVTFVESDRATAALVGTNARDLGFPQADVRALRVVQVLGVAPAEPYDVVFSDPPYPLPEADLADDLRQLAEHGWLADDALVVVERSKRSPEPTWPTGAHDRPGIVGERSKRYGEATLWYGHRS